MIGIILPVLMTLVAVFSNACTDLAIVATGTTDTGPTDTDSQPESQTDTHSVDTDTDTPIDTEPIVDGLPDGVGWYSASYLGGANGYAVRGAAIQINGHIVLAANIGDKTPDGPEYILSDASAGSGGAVVILDATGRHVISTTRIADTVSDLSLDPRDDSIYVACSDSGIVKLRADAQKMHWKQATTLPAQRVDVGPSGTVIALARATSTAEGSDGATVQLFDESGASIGSRAGAGHSADVCIDDSTGTAVLIGWRDVDVANAPTQIPYIHGYSIDTDMPLKWTGYDYDASTTDFAGSTAAIRGALCEVGVGGELAAAFTAFGGNHLLRYEPNQIDIPVGDKSVSVDDYHLMYNSHSEPKTIVEKFSSATGNLTLQTQFCARDASNATVATEPHSIYLDATGNTYLGGFSEALLPLNDATGFDPFTLISRQEPYGGGGWLLAMSSDFTERRFCTRVGKNATTYALAVRRIFTGETLVVMAGGQPSSESNGIAEVYPVQAEKLAEDTTGWFAVLRLLDP